MGKQSAKLTTFFGVILIAFTVLTILMYFQNQLDGLIYAAPVLFIVGIVLIVSSFAYYTEK